MVRKQATDRIGNASHESRLEFASGQRNDFSLAAVDEDLFQREELSNHSGPFRNRIEPGQRPVHHFLRDLVQGTRLEEPASQYSIKKSAEDVVVPKAAVVHHGDRLPAGTKHPMHFLEDAAGIRGMVNYAPAPDEIKTVVGKLKLLSIHAENICRQAKTAHPLSGALDGVFGKVNAGKRSRMSGKQ